MKVNLLLGMLVAAVAIIGAISSAVFALETRYAKEFVLKAVSERLDIKILEDRLFFLRQQIWTLEATFGAGCVNCEPRMIQSYRELLHELDNVLAELNRIRSGA